LHFKRAFVDATVAYARETWAALIEERRWSESRVACVNRRTVGQQRMGKAWPTIILQWTQQRIGVDLVARTG
jgi:hypothetical protein